MSVYIPRRKDGSPKSPFYQYDFVLKPVGHVRSQRFQGSTGQKTKAAALLVESDQRKLAALGKLGQTMTVEQACDRYQREVGNHARTIQAKRQQILCMEELKTYYGEDTLLMAIRPDTVAHAAAKRAETPVCRLKKIGGELQPAAIGRLPSASTVNRQVIEPMRRVLRRAKKHWGVPIDLEAFQWGGKDGVKRQEPDDRVRELSQEEEWRLWANLDRDYHDIAEMFIISGKRQSNWVMLPKKSVDLINRTVSMRKLKKKGWAEIKVQLNDREYEIVKKAWSEAPACEYLFTAVSRRPRDGGTRRPITKRMLYDHVTAALKAAGISDFRLHDFRHTFASRALRADPNLKKLADALDHSEIKSSAKYAHVLQEDVKRMRANVTVTRAAPEMPRTVLPKAAG